MKANSAAPTNLLYGK